MRSSDYRTHAREALRGNWPTAVLVCLVAALLGGEGLSGNINLNIPDDVVSKLSHLLSAEVMIVLAAIFGCMAVIGTIVSICMLIIGGVIQLGQSRYCLNLVDRREATFGDLFSQFSRFGSALALNLLIGLFIVLWSLLFVIPGIIAAYRYSMAFYIMLEDPDCSAMEAINRSKALMDGHKGELFWLDLSFIGWHILSAFTFGIGTLFLNPYIQTSYAVFYRNLTAQSQTGRENF